MKIILRRDTIDRMINIVKQYKAGIDITNQLKELLTHSDYQLEFERYNAPELHKRGFTEEEYVNFFLQLKEGKEVQIQNDRLKSRFSSMEEFITRVEYFEEQSKAFMMLNTSDINMALEYTINGLPDSCIFGDLEFVFSVGLGPSGGWFYKNCSHFDVVHFLKDYNKTVLMSIITHEVHHIGFNKYIESLDIDSIGLLNYFLLFLSAEGLAVKYCNNAKGILSKSIYSNDEPNIGLNLDGWNYMTSRFDDIYLEFKKTIYEIQSGTIRTMDELNILLAEYWLTSPLDSIHFSQSKNYFLGSEIWGLIHDIYGKDEVFRLLLNLDEFIEKYNAALEVIERTDLRLE